ncbi:hypothetical protein EIP86_006715 [Pleurotus ostreatoroseus]|nr:hypothetical protein EIP86_006715 [Pleurotus ostreatoroseus]
MKLVSLLLGPVLLTASTGAQYFSEGWKPGQPVQGTQDSEAAAPAYTAGAVPLSAQQGGSTGSFDLSKLFTSGPVGSLLAKAGLNFSAVNGTEEIWDPRIPLITDDNFDELIVNESLNPEEEAKRTWFLIMHSSSTLGQQQQGGISKLVDREFDAAYNTTLIEGDLPDVRWGRIDYLNVTYITTKWNTWQEFVLHYLALTMKYIYDTLVRIPKFLLMIGTGALGSILMRLMHRQPPAAAKEPKASEPEPAEQAQPVPPPTPSKKAGGKAKKGGKK